MVIRSEDTRPNVWIYVDFRDYDVGTYVRMAQQAVKENIKLPPGYTITWSGQFEYMERAKQKLYYIIPATLLIIFVIIYLNTRSVTKVIIVFLAVPFSLVGAIWLLYILGYNMSVAVWVGIIALAGLDAETGVVMLLYLDLAYEEWKKKGLLRTIGDLKEAIYHGAVKRVKTEGDDRLRNNRRTLANNVESWNRSRCDEKDSCTDGWWGCYKFYTRTYRLSGNLPYLEKLELKKRN